MNKKVVISGGVVALVIGAVAGLYFYTKKTIGKIAAAIDDTFDIEDDYIHEQKDEEINEQKIHTESVYPKDEKKRTINIDKNAAHFQLKQYPIIDEINKIKEQLKKCEDCPYKNKNQPTYPAWWGIYLPYEGEGITWMDNADDKWFRDHINTVNLFDGDDGK